jgi:LPXTG-motif cell wall-anchored protein
MNRREAGGRTHSFRVRGAVPAVLLRVLLVAVTAAGAMALMPVPMWRGVAIAAAAVGAIAPRSIGGWIGGACVGLGMLLAEPLAAQTAVAVLVVHAIHVLASLAFTVPALSWISLRALAPTLARFVSIQLVAQAVALGVAMLAAPQTGAGWAWAALAGASVLIVAVGAGLYALRRADAHADAADAGAAGVHSARSGRSGADVGGPA